MVRLIIPKRDKRRKLSPFILYSTILHIFLALIVAFLYIKEDKKHVKTDENKPEFIEITEIPIPKEKETEPPEKPKRLAEKSHKTKEEKTRDEFVKESVNVPPQPPTPKQSVPKNQKKQVAEKPEKTEKKEEVKKPKVQKTKPKLKEDFLREQKLASLPKEVPKEAKQKPEKTIKELPDITREELFRAAAPKQMPQQQPNPREFIGARNIEKKEDTVDLNTTEFKYISYFTKLKRQIEGVWSYPEVSRLKGEQGELFLMFTIRSNGYLEDIQLISSSGFARLDTEALRAIRVASPFSPFPKSWGGLEKLNVRASFRYTFGWTIR